MPRPAGQHRYAHEEHRRDGYQGLPYKGRTEKTDDNEARYAKDTKARKLAEVIGRAGIFLGLSAASVLKPAMVKTMANKPLILALANPEPEILPDGARLARPNAVVATGYSDFPNQVNNVLCFPFVFRGALDAGATIINESVKREQTRWSAAFA